MVTEIYDDDGHFTEAYKNRLRQPLESYLPLEGQVRLYLLGNPSMNGGALTTAGLNGAIEVSYQDEAIFKGVSMVKLLDSKIILVENDPRLSPEFKDEAFKCLENLLNKYQL